MRWRPATWAALLLFGVLFDVAAQDESAPPDIYRVEVVVFRHVDQSRNTAEQAPPIAGPIVNLPPPQGHNRPKLEFLLLDPKPVRIPLDLAREQLELDAVLARLERIDAYQPMLHFGWQQTEAGRAEARDYWLSEAVREQFGLSGKLRVYKERFLHLAMELEFDPRDGSGRLAVIEESRRLRDDRLQYFDHPEFGVIAAVRKTDQAEPEDDEPSSGAGSAAAVSAVARR